MLQHDTILHFLALLALTNMYVRSLHYDTGANCATIHTVLVLALI
jgi:hypothetical protein